MAKTEYRSAIRSKKLISGAVIDLLQEKPLNKITVTDVVRRAEINRGTFYAHYSDVPDVIHAIIQSYFLRIREVMTSESRTLADLPNTLMRQLQSMLEEDMDLCRKVMSSSASALMEDQLVEIVVDYLLQHEQEFSETSHEKYVATIGFCAGGLSNLYRDWFSGKLPISLSELTEIAVRLLESVMAAGLK